MADSPGLPILWGRSKSEALAFVRDRVKSKVQGWKHALLSHGGREVLIKAVANAIPTYSMSCFLFPKKTCGELDSIISNFWWGHQGGNGSIHWLAWRKLSKSKGDGGLGFKDFVSFNLALLAKQGWRILTSPDDLWVRIIKGIYFPNTDFMSAVKGARASWAWSSILEGRKLLEGKLCWSIGNGRDVDFWHDPWIPDLPDNRISSTPHFEALDSVVVAEFIINKRWDLSNVDTWLTTDEIKAIHRIPIPGSFKEDSLKWIGSTDGAYSVKMGYRAALTGRNLLHPSNLLPLLVPLQSCGSPFGI